MSAHDEIFCYRGWLAEGKLEIFHHQLLDDLFFGGVKIIVLLFYVIDFDFAPLQSQELTSLLQDGIPFCQITLGQG